MGSSHCSDSCHACQLPKPARAHDRKCMNLATEAHYHQMNIDKSLVFHYTVTNMQQYVLEYITDVEGNWEYFCRYVEGSHILEWDGVERGAYGPGKLQMKPKGLLVFGGDACDKGPGDIRFARILLDLYFRYPGQVFIILGNRDINKLRFSAELEPGVEPMDFLPWDRNAKSLAEWCVEHGQEDTAVNRLRWMLHFMGCQRTTFRTRKQELALLSSTHSATDEAVLESFRASVDPDGKDPWMLTLLRVGKLALVLGDTLFVHGGFHEAVMEKVPGRLGDADDATGDIKRWADDLNAWKDAQLDQFVQQPKWCRDGKGGRSRGAEDLILYGTPGYPGQATVVYFNPFKDGNPQLLSPQVEDYLQMNGIKRVLSGHQPHGQSPAVVRHPRTGLLTVTADTSYSNLAAEKIFNEANNRGSVVSVVRLEGDWLVIEGTLADGARHKCRLHSDEEKCEWPDRLVGHQQTDGSWIKTVLDRDRDLVQSVLGKGPPRFELLTNTSTSSMAHFNLREDHRYARIMPDLCPADLNCRRDSLDCNPSAYAKEFHMEEKVLSRLGGRLRSISCSDDLRFRRDEFDKADTYVCSWIGVVENLTGGPEMEEKVVAKINELLGQGKRVIFVSNSSHLSRDDFAANVVKKGINMTKQAALNNVLNTAFTAAWYLKEKKKQRPFVICSEKGLLDELRRMGITQYVATIHDNGTEKQEYLGKATADGVMRVIKANACVDSVVVGWDQQLTMLKMAVASTYIGWNLDESYVHHRSTNSNAGNQGLLVITCSSDRTGILGLSPATYMPEKNFNGRPIMTPGNGSMADLLSVQDHDSLSTHFENQGLALSVGKPSAIMIRALEERCGVNMQSAMVIGDSLESDIQWAQQGGMKSLLVLSGRTTAQTAQRVEADDYEGVLPTWILNSLADC